MRIPASGGAVSSFLRVGGERRRAARAQPAFGCSCALGNPGPRRRDAAQADLVSRSCQLSSWLKVWLPPSMLAFVFSFFYFRPKTLLFVMVGPIGNYFLHFVINSFDECIFIELLLCFIIGNWGPESLGYILKITVLWLSDRMESPNSNSMVLHYRMCFLWSHWAAFENLTLPS